MQYIDLINAFNKWCETNYLPSSSQLLWFKLVAIFNSSGWCEWISVDNLRLMGIMQIRREATFVGIRNSLIDKKFFEFQKGKKGSPNKYKICTVNFESIKGSIKSSEKSSTNSSIKRSKYRRHK